MWGHNVSEDIASTVRMFRKEMPIGTLEAERRLMRELRHAERYLDLQRVTIYKGFPTGLERKGFKAVKDFLLEDGVRLREDRCLIYSKLTDSVLLDAANGYYVEIPNEFDVYLDGYQVRGNGGRAIKVFATNNNIDYYYIDMREYEFYDFLTRVENTAEPKINEVGKLEGKFVLYKEGSNLKPISVNDSRVRHPEN